MSSGIANNSCLSLLQETKTHHNRKLRGAWCTSQNKRS